jgi:hypothetical protein
MSQVADSGSSERFAREADAIELRIFRVMIASVALAVAVAVMLMPWRFAVGLTLGGVLSLLNYHWLRTSVAALFSIDLAIEKPRVKVSRYLLRYFVIGLIALTAYKLQMVSLPATITGLCAFVPALFVEAGRQFYFSIINREESF